MSTERRPSLRGNSPWGTIDHLEAVKGSGGELIIVSTPSHGGMWIGPSLRIRFRLMFPNFKPFAGFPWLEEDCDICLGVLAFPEFFTERQVNEAKRIVLGMRSYFGPEAEVIDRMDQAALAN